MVESCPQFLPYMGPVSPAHSVPEGSSLTPEDLDGIKGERLAGQETFPVPEGSPGEFIDGEKDNLPEEDTALSQLIMAEQLGDPDVLETLRKMGEASPSPPPPVYLHDPVESLIWFRPLIHNTLIEATGDALA